MFFHGTLVVGVLLMVVFLFKEAPFGDGMITIVGHAVCFKRLKKLASRKVP